MPSNEYYDSTGNPLTRSTGDPAIIRAEFDSIEDGFDKLPPLATHNSEVVFVNAAATALESVPSATTLSRIGAEATVNKDVSGGYVGLSGYKIKIKNAAGTIISLIESLATIARNWTLPDRDGTVALTDDIPQLKGKNSIINADFSEWRRATSQTTDGYESVDRWRSDSNGSTYTLTRQAHTVGQVVVPGYHQYYAQDVVVSSAGAGNFHRISQRIEGVGNFSGGDVTASLYAKANASKNIAIEFVQCFGTGGAPSADVTGIGAQQFTLTTSWDSFQATVAIPSISGKTLGSDGNDYLELRIWFDAGSTFNASTNTLGQQSGTFSIGAVQVEAGEAMTDLEALSVGENLELCQRYYQEAGEVLFSSDVTVANSYYGIYNFTTTMRAIPTVSSANLADFNFPAAVGTLTVTDSDVMEERTSDGSGAGLFRTQVIVDAEL